MDWLMFLGVWTLLLGGGGWLVWFVASGRAFGRHRRELAAAGITPPPRSRWLRRAAVVAFLFVCVFPPVRTEARSFTGTMVGVDGPRRCFVLSLGAQPGSNRECKLDWSRLGAELIALGAVGVVLLAVTRPRRGV
mgnify:CR=1 FL=1